MIPTMIGKAIGNERRQEHLLDRRVRDDVDGAAVVRPAGALEDAGDLPELAAHLVHDQAADAPDRLHGERGEQERHQAADEEARDHPGVVEREDARQALLREPARVLVEEDERGEAGGADRVALRDRLRRVPDGVERVGDAAHGLVQVGHLGDAAGVVRHRPVGVERDDQAGHRRAAPSPRRRCRRGCCPTPRRRRRSRPRSRSTGSAVACMPTASPSMMFVAWPVCDEREIDFTGPQRVPV